MSGRNTAKIMISSAIGAGIGILFAAAATLAMAAVLAIGNIPAVLIMPLATAALAVGGLSAGISAAKIGKSRGILCGSAAGDILFLVVWACGGIIGEGSLGASTAIKAGVIILFGAIGGIVGVNR